MIVTRGSLKHLSARCDYVLFGGGGVIQRGTGRHARLFAELRPALACVGMSVEAVHRDNKDLIEVLKEKSQFILVRDEQSGRAFGSHSKVVVGPDLTFLFPFDVATSPEQTTCGVNLLPWRYWQGEYKGAYDKLMRRVDRKLPFAERVYPLPKWKPHKAMDTLSRSFENLTPIPLYFEGNRESDADALSPFFASVDRRFSPSALAGCGALTSMRFHGLVFACQMGIPFVSLSYQPKNVVFCRASGMESYSVDLFRPAQLRRAIRSLRASYREVRDRLIDVRMRNHREITSLIRGLFPTSMLSTVYPSE